MPDYVMPYPKIAVQAAAHSSRTSIQHRRQFLLSAAASAVSIAMQSTSASASATPSARGQSVHYPSAPVRIVVGFAAGGTADTFARLIAAKAGEILRTPVIVDNKPSAGAILGADHVAKAAGDGHTLFLTFSEALVSNTALYRHLPYQPARDFQFIAQLAAGPLVICVNKSVPADNLRALVAHAKTGAMLNFGSWGNGSHGHLLCEALNRHFQLDLLHIAYKGEAPTIQDLLGGQIHIAAGSIGNMRPHIQSGALKAIGVIGHQPSRALPTVPTLAAQGATDAAFTTLGWVGVVAPAATPRAIVQRLSDVMREIMVMADVNMRFSNAGFEPRYLDSEAFFKQWQRDIPVWTRLVRDAGVTLD